jgi:hypothetical protein
LAISAAISNAISEVFLLQACINRRVLEEINWTQRCKRDVIETHRSSALLYKPGA